MFANCLSCEWNPCREGTFRFPIATVGELKAKENLFTIETLQVPIVETAPLTCHLFLVAARISHRHGRLPRRCPELIVHMGNLTHTTIRRLWRHIHRHLHFHGNRGPGGRNDDAERASYPTKLGEMINHHNHSRHDGYSRIQTWSPGHGILGRHGSLRLVTARLFRHRVFVLICYRVPQRPLTGSPVSLPKRNKFPIRKVCTYHHRASSSKSIRTK
jgi:hypothetical protein